MPAVALLSACAQGPHRPYDAATRAAVRATDVVVSVPQNELNAQIVVANSAAATAQFGLIGALVGAAIDSGINASRASTAEEQVRPLRDKLLGFDFDARLKADLQRELATVDWLRSGPVAVRKTAVDDKARSALAVATSADGVLVLQTAYELTPDFSTLRLTSQASLVPQASAPGGQESKKQRHDRQRKAGGMDAARYYNQIVVEAPLQAASSLEGNRQAWGDGDLLARTLKAQVAELARLVAIDLQYETPADANAAPVSPLAAGPATPSRFKDGTLRSVIALSAVPPTPEVAVAEPALPAMVEPAAIAPAAPQPSAEPAAMPAAAPAPAAAPTPADPATAPTL